MKSRPNKQLLITRLNDKGYGLAVDENNREYLILNSLPGETVVAEIFKKKGSKLYGKAVEIMEKSIHRAEPKDEHFLSSSPWQNMSIDYEIEIKKDLINKAFEELGQLKIQDFDIYTQNESKSWNYRNKVEFGFYGDENEQIFLSFFMRGGSFGKYPLPFGDSLLKEKINLEALKIVKYLNTQNIRAKDLKTLILRYSNYEDKVTISLFVKNPNISFTDLKSLLNENVKGISIFYSNPNCPASIVSNTQEVLGDMDLIEKIDNTIIKFGWDNFFQVNISVFEQCIKDIKDQLKNINSSKSKDIIDMYAGVGTIGLLLKDYANNITGVEIFPGSKIQAMYNANQNNLKNYTFFETPSEKALDEIVNNKIIILDPPRAGLHVDVVNKLIEVSPEYIVYLSCNYQTQAENISILKQVYDITFFKGYNFYPHTPHVETLMILKLKK